MAICDQGRLPLVLSNADPAGGSDRTYRSGGLQEIPTIRGNLLAWLLSVLGRGERGRAMNVSAVRPTHIFQLLVPVTPR